MTDKEKARIQKEILDTVIPHAHGRLLLAPRVGKTKIIIDLIKRDKPKTILWVTPERELADTDIPAEFVKWRAKSYLSRLTTTTWKSLEKEVGFYELIVLDEDHFITELNSQNLVDKKLYCKHIISMTGTPTEHVFKRDLYRKLNLKPLYKITINDAVDMKLLSNYSIKVLEVNLGTTKNIEAGTKEKRFMTTEAGQYAFLDRTARAAMFQNRKDAQFRILARMRAIKNSSTKHEAAWYLINNLKGRKLVFCATIKQADDLCIDRFHSKTDTKSLKLFKEGAIDTITMVNAGGSGHTYKSIDHLILVQADSNKNGTTSQKICRTLLSQKDYQATIWVIVLKGTQDETWVEKALTSFDQTKVEYLKFSNIEMLESKISQLCM